ncbi:MAG: phosphotransferase [Kiritimatiellaeota bacterium]|nr:phosphotransferase [Kiritimatiellota bacterium]
MLAAGFGTRLRPLTLRTPKPLLPLWGVPLLARVLRQLEAWGVSEIFVNTHWLPEAFREFFTRHAFDARVTLSHEPEILGTGGALRPLQKQLEDGPFWLVNADIAFDLDPAPLLRAFHARPCVASVWLKPDAGPRTVETDCEGRVTSWRSNTPGANNTATLTGVHVVSPDIFRFLPADKNVFSILDPYQAADGAGLPVMGVQAEPSFWSDIGTHQSYYQTHANLVGRGVSSAPPLESIDRYRNPMAAGKDCPPYLPDVKNVSTLEPADPSREACRELHWPRAVSVFLGARGSNRSFWRVASPDANAIVIHDSGGRAENLRYAPLARNLHDAGIPVPRVLFENRGTGLLVLEDLGDLSLKEAETSNPQTVYTQVLDEVHAFHQTATRLDLDLEPPFDEALYTWEQNLFEEHQLRRRGKSGLPPRAREEYARVTARLLASPRAVIHRDLQSTNLFLCQNRWHFIDFQGMRRGAIAYDLASLLCDPYAALDASDRATLLRHYASLCEPAAASRLLDDFHFAAVQRLTQAMGAYGRLAALGHAEFERHLVPAARLLVESARCCGLGAVSEMADVVLDNR